VLETILNIVDYGMAPQEAVKAHRAHHQWPPDELAYERAGPMPEAVAELSGIGYKLIEPGRGRRIDRGCERPVLRRQRPRRPAGAAVGTECVICALNRLELVNDQRLDEDRTLGNQARPHSRSRAWSNSGATSR